MKKAPLFELTPEDLHADPSLQVVRPGRLSVGLSLVNEAHAQAIADFRGLDAKAGNLIGWVATIFAIALFQNAGFQNFRLRPILVVDHGPQYFCEGLSFLCLVISLLFAIRLQKPADVFDAAIWDPMDAYNYQAGETWDTIAASGITPDRLAEAQTQLKLIQFTDAAVRSLRAASATRQRLLAWAHGFFVGGIGLLAVALVVSGIHF